LPPRIPANTPHLPYNMSQIELATAVISRTDPNEQESVVLLPELDAIARQRRRLATRLDLTAPDLRQTLGSFFKSKFSAPRNAGEKDCIGRRAIAAHKGSASRS
jgi:hypothetical protein